MRTVVDQRRTSARSSSPRTRSRTRVAELGAQICSDLAGRQLTLVSVLKGSLPFMADLMRAISLPLRIDLMEVSSYGGATTESSGLVRILKDLSSSIEGEDVLIVEDIIDTGPDAELPRPLPARQEARVAADLHPPRQARPPARRDRGRLHRLHDPGPVRRRLRPRLRRAVPQPALRGRPPARGLQPKGDRGQLAHDDASPPGRAVPPPRRDRRARGARRLLPAVVDGRRRPRAAGR